MTEATGFEAKTIHRLLEIDPKGGGFKRGADNPLDCDMMVVDEASMVDVMLMQALMKAVLDKAAVDLTQTVRGYLDDVENLFAKGAHELLSVNRTNASDPAGREVLLDAVGRTRE